MKKLVALLVVLVALAPVAAAAKPPRAPYATLAVVDVDPPTFYWSSAVGSTHVVLGCDNGFSASETTGGWTPINGFVSFADPGDTDCTAELLSGARVLASVSFAA